MNLDIALKKKLVLYQPLLRKQVNFGAQLERGRVGGFPCLSLKIDKNYSNIGKNCLVCVHLELNSHLKCSFKNILKKKKNKIFPCRALLLYVVHELFTKVLLLQETCPVPKNLCLCACNFQLNFSC